MKKCVTIIFLSALLIYCATFKGRTDLVWVGIGCAIIGGRAAIRMNTK